MKKFNQQLLVLALAGICCAYVGKVSAWHAPKSMHTYEFAGRSADGLKYYVSKDLTASGWQKGNQYDCVTPATICTLIADPIHLHTDFWSMYFYISDVPVSGIDKSGVFVTL